MNAALPAEAVARLDAAVLRALRGSQPADLQPLVQACDACVQALADAPAPRAVWQLARAAMGAATGVATGAAAGVAGRCAALDAAQWATARQLAMQLLMHSRAGTDAAPPALTQGLLAWMVQAALDVGNAIAGAEPAAGVDADLARLQALLPASQTPASESASSDFLHEADALSQQLSQGVAHGCASGSAGSAPSGTIGMEAVQAVEAAHALAQACAAAQLPGLALLSLRIEQALLCACHGASGDAGRAEASAALQAAADEVHALLHRYAAGFVREPSAAVMDALAGVIAAT